MKVDEIVERPGKHLVEDGVVELMLGIQFFLSGVVFWFMGTLPHGPGSGRRFYSFVQSGLFLIVVFACSWGIKRLKERVIAPRAGYVIPREEEVDIRISSKGIQVDSTSKRYFIVAVALILWTVGLLASIPGLEWFQYVPHRWRLMFGASPILLVAAFFSWAALRYRMPRYFWLSALAVLLGASSPRHNDVVPYILLVMAVLAGGSALIGAWRLKAFLAANRKLGGPDDKN